MPLAASSSSSAFQPCNAGSEPNTVPLCAPEQEGVRVSVKNTFIEVGPSSPPPLRRSITVANVSASSIEHTDAVSEELRLPLSLSDSLDIADVPATPCMGMLGRSPMDGYFDPSLAQSPMARWLEGTPRTAANECGSSCTEDGSPLQRWLQGAPRADEASYAGALGAFAMGPNAEVQGQAYFSPFGQPMMWQSAPMMPNAHQHAQTAFQPTVVVVPQQPMPVVWHSNSEASARDDAPAASSVWEGMAAWKARQSGVDRECMGKPTRSQLNTSTQNVVRPRGTRAISKKPADMSASAGPRAVFVDLSKIMPTGLVN